MSPFAPVPGFNFTVAFLDARPGFGAPLIASFSEVSGLNFETETEEYREGGNNTAALKFPKWGKFPNLVFKRGVTADPGLWAWIEQVTSGPGAPNRKNGIITLSDRGAPAGPVRPPIAAWFFRNGLPEKVQGPALNAKGNEIAIETLEVVHEGLTRIGASVLGAATNAIAEVF